MAGLQNFPRRQTRRRRLIRAGAILGCVLLLAWTGGLFWFAAELESEPVASARRSDAIVVLTGGSLRVEQGIELLSRGLGEKLFVSGVAQGVDVKLLLKVFRESEDLSCCISLGYEADNTAGNARETAAWMREQGYSSMRLVTAAYHMPRSLLEFRRSMPDMEIIAHPVFPAHVKQQDWWRWPGSTSLLVSEYTKYLVARLRALILPAQS